MADSIEDKFVEAYNNVKVYLEHINRSNLGSELREPIANSLGQLNATLPLYRKNIDEKNKEASSLYETYVNDWDNYMAILNDCYSEINTYRKLYDTFPKTPFSVEGMFPLQAYHEEQRQNIEVNNNGDILEAYTVLKGYYSLE